jgi:hypothetical protein
LVARTSSPNSVARRLKTPLPGSTQTTRFQLLGFKRAADRGIRGRYSDPTHKRYRSSRDDKKNPQRVLPEKRRDQSAPTMLFSGMLTKFYLLEEGRSIGSTDPLVGSLAIATEAVRMVGATRPTLDGDQ